MTSLLIEKAAFMLSVQDWGRSGYRRYGLPSSGPMDWLAFECANHLVGNRSGGACLEVGFSSCEITLLGQAFLAVCGAGYEVRLNRRRIPLWMAFIGKRGDQLTIKKIPGGNWAYLAAAGGLQSPMWMGSHSAYVRARLGKMLFAGDRVQLADFTYNHRSLAGQCIPDSEKPSYAANTKLRVIPGPHQARFQKDSLQTFWTSAYQVSTQSDRMGYRLTGPALTHQDGADLISQGLVPGEIQVPRDGQPIVMMADHPTTGGYPCLGTVAKVDLPLLAQAEPIRNQICFSPISAADARVSLKKAVRRLKRVINLQEDQWLQL